MSQRSAVVAYAARADEYIGAVGRIEHAEPGDLSAIGAWAQSLDGPVLDVGCGPGQWTHWLSSRGIDIAGVDPVPEFIDRARSTYPEDRFRVGTAESLGVETGSLAGILAWYSLIHHRPADIPTTLAEFARCLRPGGGLALGFFTAADQAPFDHAAATAHYWPVDQLAADVEAAGFRVTRTATRAGRPDRMHGEILATKN